MQIVIAHISFFCSFPIDWSEPLCSWDSAISTQWLLRASDVVTIMVRTVSFPRWDPPEGRLMNELTSRCPLE
ncbi:hypothetical protein EDB19DRAFT_1730045 [Suillus lakei]|nr:hypothetical protein EDB19DRAFT_1730045 [Suillus lakei]